LAKPADNPTQSTPKPWPTPARSNLTQTRLGAFIATRNELEVRSNELFDHITGGTLTVPSPQRYPLADAAQAHHALETASATGKLILVPPQRD